MAAPILYEVNTRAWLRDLSENAGHPLTLADIPEAQIQRWQSLGFSHIWLMGVWQVGPKARQKALEYWRDHWRNEVPSSEEDVHGSPFAIQEYAVDSRLGDPLSLLVLKERLNRAGLRLILDFVPNHLGIDSPEPRRYPARFVQTGQPRPGTFEAEARFGNRFFAHGRDPYFPPWSDTVQLDYRVIETQKAMTAIAQTICACADGLRCDMAMLLLPEIFEQTWKDFPCQGAHQAISDFWRRAIPAIRQLQPNSELIAEVYWDRESELQETGFDYTYNKRVYDYLLRGDYRELLDLIRNAPPLFLRRSLHFIENHDEPRIASLLPLRRHQTAAALLLFLPGIALLHDGQLEGRTSFARIQMTKRLAEKPDREIVRLYEELLRAVARSSVRSGKPTLIPTDAPKVLVIKWEAKASDLAIVNLGGVIAELALDHHLLGISTNPEILYTTQPGETFIRSKPDHLQISLPAESACIIRLGSSET